MAQDGSTAHTQAPGVRVFVLLATLAGLFAMHGMSDHGTGAHADPASDSHAAHAAMSTLPEGSEVATRSVAPVDWGSSGHSEMDMVGLCLAILAGALLVVALARVRLVRALDSLLPRAASPRWRVAGRDRDPPSLISLSIQRC